MFLPIAPFLSGKQALRERLKAERRAAAAARPDAALHACANFLRAIPVDAGMTVALYDPIRGELDVGPLRSALTERGARILLPAMRAKNAPLEFRLVEMEDALIEGRFGVREPSVGAEQLRPGVVVTPLLGFTRSGDRLGYGAGFYDRTIEALRAAGPLLTVGFAFGAQEVDAIPSGPHDQRLDWIVTEREAIKT